jgi:hypothetical protein
MNLGIGEATLYRKLNEYALRGNLPQPEEG